MSNRINHTREYDLPELITQEHYGECWQSFIYSPDDGGWYVQQDRRRDLKVRFSKTVFSSPEAAKARLKRGRIKWGPWE